MICRWSLVYPTATSVLFVSLVASIGTAHSWQPTQPSLYSIEGLCCTILGLALLIREEVLPVIACIMSSRTGGFSSAVGAAFSVLVYLRSETLKRMIWAWNFLLRNSWFGSIDHSYKFYTSHYTGSQWIQFERILSNAGNTWHQRLPTSIYLYPHSMATKIQTGLSHYNGVLSNEPHLKYQCLTIKRASTPYGSAWAIEADCSMVCVPLSRVHCDTTSGQIRKYLFHLKHYKFTVVRFRLLFIFRSVICYHTRPWLQLPTSLTQKSQWQYIVAYQGATSESIYICKIYHALSAFTWTQPCTGIY